MIGCFMCFHGFYRGSAGNAKHGIAKAFLSVRPSVRLSVCQTRGF